MPNPRSRARLSLSLALLLLLTASRQAAAAVDLAATAIGIVSARTGLAADQLAVHGSTPAVYPLSAAQVTVFKVQDPAGQIYGVALDAAGAEVDTQALEMQESHLYLTAFGRMDPGLQAIVKTTPAGSPIAVALWVTGPLLSGPPRPTLVSDLAAPKPSAADIDQLYAAADAQRAIAVRWATDPIVAEIQALGWSAVAEPYSPVIFANLPPETLMGLNG
jgi:hypothetical protein